MAIKCRKCGIQGHEARGVVLQRVNEKGVEGIWECRPICGARMGDSDAIGAALEGVFDETVLGPPLSDCNDIEFLRSAATRLWDLLDDIDTVSDIVKSDDAAYREQVERIQRRRGKVLVSDGYKLFLLPVKKET